MQILLALSLGIETAVTSSIASPYMVQNELETMVERAVDGVKLMDELQSELSAYLEKNKTPDSVWSVSVVLPESGLRADITADPQTAASSIKLFVAGAVLSNMDSFQENVYDLNEDDIHELIRDTLTYSDNDAATTLVCLMGNGDMAKGKENINAWISDHGYQDTYLGIIFAGFDDTGTYNATTAVDTADFMVSIINHQIPGSDELLTCLEEQDRTSKIPQAVQAKTANKTGELIGTENDTCIVFGKERTFVISIMADQVENDHAVPMIQEMARMAYRKLEGQEAETQADDSQVAEGSEEGQESPKESEDAE